MDKQGVYRFLREQGIEYECVEHPAAYNMEEMSHIALPYPEADAKNLFVRDERKRDYCLITVKGEKRVDLKAFRQRHGTRPLRFASPEELRDILGLLPGHVTPLGILNDEERRVRVYLDAAFREPPGLVGVHPNENTATLFLKTEDLLRLLRDHGNPVELTELKTQTAAR